MNNSELQQRKDKAIARGEGNAYQVYVKRAKNAELWDVEGKRYIDFGSGIAVVNTGHCHPKVTAAVKEQVESFSHTCLMVTPYESAVTLAEQINAALAAPDWAQGATAPGPAWPWAPAGRSVRPG